MSGFLDRMAGASRARLEAARAREPLAELRARALATPLPPPLRRRGGFDLIAEFKRRSPALGELGGGDDLESRVSAYASAGAAAVSVLTEPSEFNGSLAELAAAAAALRPLDVPVMRKDFLIDPYQLHEARAAGAGGALLIVRLLSPEQLSEMLDCARELRLFVLLEAFDAADIARATASVAARVGEVAGSPRASESSSSERASGEPGRIPPDRAAVFVGVNCRDLQTLAVLPQRFGTLAPLLPRDVVRVAESGIGTAEDCATVARLGYGMALVGGALMSAAAPAASIRAMLAAGRAAA